MDNTGSKWSHYSLLTEGERAEKREEEACRNRWRR